MLVWVSGECHGPHDGEVCDDRGERLYLGPDGEGYCDCDDEVMKHTVINIIINSMIPATYLYINITTIWYLDKSLVHTQSYYTEQQIMVSVSFITLIWLLFTNNKIQ